jgi:hypothetical protein
MGKLEFLLGKLSCEAVLHHILQTENVEAVVCVVRRNGVWETVRGGTLDYGGLSMATIHLLHETQRLIHGET